MWEDFRARISDEGNGSYKKNDPIRIRDHKGSAMNGLLRRDWQKERSQALHFLLGWRVTEVHTNGMKFTDHGEKVGSAGARSVRSMLRRWAHARYTGNPAPANVPIAQDSSVNDQTRFMMCKRSYGVRGCVRSRSHRMLLLLHLSTCDQLKTCRTRLQTCENMYPEEVVHFPAGIKCCSGMAHASTDRRFDGAKTRLQPCLLHLLSCSLPLAAGAVEIQVKSLC